MAMTNRNRWQELRALLNQMEAEGTQIWPDSGGIHSSDGQGGLIFDEDQGMWTMYVTVRGPIMDQVL